MTELWTLTLFAVCVAIWVSIMRAREKAIVYAKKICAEEGVQLLDFTVALERLSLTRDEHGRAAFRRGYCFEFSDTGNNRREGRIILIGNRLESSYMEPHRFPQDLRSVGEVLH